MSVLRVFPSASALAATVILSGALLAQMPAAAAAQPEAHASNSQGSVAQNRITILYDAFGRDGTMKKDWGFAALIEARGKRILFDTGNNSEVFAHNVQVKRVDLTALDFVVMSHRHGDHVGGLNYLLGVNPKVTIFAPKENFGVFGSSFPGTFYRRNDALPPDMRYFDGQPPETVYFGTPWPQGKFTWVSKTSEVAPGIHLIVLKGSWGVDLDVMEISLAIDTPEGVVLVVGCSHPGIEKIVEAAKLATDKPVHLIVGGLHLLPAKDEDTQRIAIALRDIWKVAWIAPGHCTGEPAFEILKATFGERYLYAGLGATVVLGATPTSAVVERRYTVSFDDADRRTYRELVRFSSEVAESH